VFVLFNFYGAISRKIVVFFKQGVYALVEAQSLKILIKLVNKTAAASAAQFTKCILLYAHSRTISGAKLSKMRGETEF